MDVSLVSCKIFYDEAAAQSGTSASCSLSSLILIYPLLTCVDLCISSPPPPTPAHHSISPLNCHSASSLVLHAPALPPTSQCFCFHWSFKTGMLGTTFTFIRFQVLNHNCSLLKCLTAIFISKFV